jgi:hypothetical protein
MYSIIFIDYADPLCRVYVASDEVNLKADPQIADGVWYVDKDIADNLSVGDYVKIPEVKKMLYFTEWEMSGAVWMFSLPGWSEEAYHCFSKAKFDRVEALAEFCERYDVKPGDTVLEFRAEDHTVKCIPLFSI